MKSIFFTFRGTQAMVVDSRVPEDKKKETLHYYEIRHHERDWGNPIMIQPHAPTNFWGTIITKEPLIPPVSGLTAREKLTLYHACVSYMIAEQQIYKQERYEPTQALYDVKC